MYLPCHYTTNKRDQIANQSRVQDNVSKKTKLLWLALRAALRDAPVAQLKVGDLMEMYALI